LTKKVKKFKEEKKAQALAQALAEGKEVKEVEEAPSELLKVNVVSFPFSFSFFSSFSFSFSFCFSFLLLSLLFFFSSYFSF